MSIFYDWTNSEISAMKRLDGSQYNSDDLKSGYRNQRYTNEQTRQMNHTPIAMGEGDMELHQDKHQQRKQAPVFSGAINYFPDALWQVAVCSRKGNEQHNPGEPLHWAREKSTDEPDALLRHLIQYDKMDDDGILHATKVAWRALALLQRTLESRGEAHLSNHNQ